MSKKKEIYLANKAKKVGDVCICPICGAEFVKKQWQQAFCRRECKEKFWNEKGDRHRDKNYYHNYNMKHPERYDFLLGVGNTESEREENYAIWMFANDEGFREYVRDSAINGDGGWDEHACSVSLATMLENYEGRDID